MARLTRQDIDKMKQQSKVSTQIETLEIVAQPNSTAVHKLQIPANGSMEIEQILCSYTTLDDNGGAPIDNGVHGISIKIMDRGTQRQLTDVIPLVQIGTPGRVKSLPSSGEPSNVLQIPFSWVYFLENDSALEFEVTSTNTYVNDVIISVKGKKYYV